ncbi:hypothetical protein FF38_01687 [Lucilia cuprina]|uniref:Uncharacterized protein n=1 Tax=Lucilia cuprina TaxID=7375 RepID=A0A0L0CBX9_LUCCU|nr:hypothetical protein FF38_01687 [Lucilia cuprina]
MDLHLINATTHRSVITGSIIFNQDIDQFDVLFFITSLKRNGKPWTMLNLTIKGCDFIAKSRRKNMNFPYIVLGELRAANPNFPKSCPIKKRPFVLEFHSLDYEYNKERVKIFDMKIVEYQGNSALNATVIFARDINDFYLDLKVLVPKKKRRPFVLLNMTVNGCEFLNGINNRYLKFAYFIYNQFKQFKGFPTKCPVEKDKPIYIPYFYFDSENSPPYLPVFNCRLSIVSRQKDDFLYRAHFNLRVKDKRPI